MAEVDGNIPDLPPPKPDSTPPFHVPGAVFFVAVMAVLSLLPSQAPEFVLVKRWELLHLLLIAIAVSCGLFSGKYSNADHPGAGHGADSKTTTSPERLGFCEDSEVEGEEKEEEFERGWPEELGRTQLWSSLYHRHDPAPLVTEEKRPGTGSRPLCLPVRSLRSHVVSEPAPAFNETLRSRDEAYVQTTSPNEADDDEEDHAAGASPLPRRSRSARMTGTETEPGTSSHPTPMSTSPDSGGFRAPYLPCASTGSLAPSQCARLEQRTGSGRRGDAVKSGKPGLPCSPPPTPSSRRPANRYASAGLHPSRRQVRSRIPREEEPEAADNRRGRGLPSNTYGFSPRNCVRDPIDSDARWSGSAESSDEDAGQRDAASGSSTVTDTEEDDGRSSPTPAPGTRNEVDRKAEEFIAKIRKQIGHQKLEPGNERLQDTNTRATD